MSSGNKVYREQMIVAAVHGLLTSGDGQRIGARSESAFEVVLPLGVIGNGRI
jgi:flagellar biosynthesis/type III secretory pathway ATPase